MPASRGLVFTAPWKVEWEDIDLPDGPPAGHVFVKARRSVISPGTELATLSGSHIRFTIPDPSPWEYPQRPGYCMVGTVAAVGQGVSGMETGDRVLSQSPHRSMTDVDTEAVVVQKVPQGLDDGPAGLARLSAIAMNGVRLAGLKLGETAAVFGAGLLGQFSAQICRLSGGRNVTIVDGIDARLEIAHLNGVDQVVPAGDDTVERLREITGGRGFDVVIEATGNPDAVPDALKAAARGGRLVLTGSTRGTVEINPYAHIHQTGVSVIGAHENIAGNPPVHSGGWTSRENVRLSLDLLADGSLTTLGFLTDEVPAERAAQVYELLANDPARHLGVVLHWLDV